MHMLDKIKFTPSKWPNLKIKFDFKELPEFVKGCEEISAYLRAISNKATIGHLAREFPQHQRLLLDILEHLKNEKAIEYDECKPFPTLIQKLI